MRSISRPPSTSRDRAYWKRHAHHAIDKDKTLDIRDFLIAAEKLGGIASFTGNQKRVYEQSTLLRHWYTILWSLSGPNARPATIDLPAGPTQFEPFPKYPLSCVDDDWKICWGLAWTFDDSDLAAALLQAGWELTLPGPGVKPTRFALMTTEILQRIAESDPHWIAMCREGIELSKKETVGPRMFKYYQASHTVFRLLEATTRYDQPDLFNDRLYDAVLGYRNNLERKNSLSTEKLAIAWQILGITAKAYRAGVPIQVESDYIPAWIYRAEWPT